MEPATSQPNQRRTGMYGGARILFSLVQRSRQPNAVGGTRKCCTVSQGRTPDTLGTGGSRDHTERGDPRSWDTADGSAGRQLEHTAPHRL
jgi:hypothetical protein